MTKRKHNLIIVSILFILLLGLLFFLTSMPLPQKDMSSKTDEPIFENIINMKDKQIISIAVKNQNESYEIKVENKDDKKVYILSGLDEEKTSQSNAGVMFDSLVNLKPNRIIEDVQDLSNYGLEKVNAELLITFDDNEKITLYLGNDAPTSSDAYLKVDRDSKIYLINQMDKEIFLNEKNFYQEKE